mgnify:CR=1 FL=1
MSLKEHWRIDVILPVENTAPQSLPLKMSEAITICPVLEDILTLLGKSDPIGREGNYECVYSILPGIGGFVPGEGASPVNGKPGITASGPNYVFRTHAPVDIDFSLVENFINAVAAIHPWEHPTISLTRPVLWAPD